MRYPKIVMWWSDATSETEMKLYNKTIAEAREAAILFGYKPPVWYKPWQYIFGSGLNFLTVGFPVKAVL